MLPSKKYLRYERHIDLPGVGEAGQFKLLNARVLIVGAGGLGTPAAAYLAAAGIGTLHIVDDDTVEKTNLQRQIFYTDADVKKSKAEALRARLLALNPEITIDAISQRLTEENGDALVAACDLVLDGSDNFATKYLLNDLCLRHRKPLVYGAVFKFDGQVSVFQGFAPGQPCYRCFYRDVPDHAAACTEAAIFGPLVGTIGALQAGEAIKMLLGLPTLTGHILLCNALTGYHEKIMLAKDPNCPACKKS